MHSEFYNVELNAIRYSLVWEDSSTLNHALAIDASDHVMVITSAGCNVLNTVLKDPASVTAVDLNPVQNKLLAFKQHVICNHPYRVFRKVMGFDGEEAVQGAKEKVFEALTAKDKIFWSSFFDAHPQGLITSGKLERYITHFCSTLPACLQEKLQALLTFSDVEKQYAFFIDHLHHSRFRELFINYFDDENLSKGRDPKLLKYATETGGQAFYNRLVQQVKSTLVATNFYFRFFFFGPFNLPEDILPPCYRECNYKKLQQQVSKIKIVTAEAIDYLLSQEGLQVNKASLSNIFEYTSKAEFNTVVAALATRHRNPLRIVFWNLLNGQGACEGHAASYVTVCNIPTSAQSCFYFKNVVLLEYAAAPFHHLTFSS
jgi:S-adenosylmethionine-diacylglycerol 3-amino-3-carboxypropyl transferase